LDDIDVGLGGLQSYDLRGLSQPTTIDAYDDANVSDVDKDDEALRGVMNLVVVTSRMLTILQ